VALTAAHLTLVYLSFDFAPAKAATNKVANRVHLVAAHMVKFKQHRICLAAVNARMVMQILENPFDYFRFGSTAVARHVGDMKRLIPGIPAPLYYSLALFTLGAQTVWTSSIAVKIRCAFQRRAGRTYFGLSHGECLKSNKGVRWDALVR
jgi:hypothetical protein